ncbi:MAG: hypothetical protein ACQERT_10655, partial [Thermodesulfobacteriota bacterium]
MRAYIPQTCFLSTRKGLHPSPGSEYNVRRPIVCIRIDLHPEKGDGIEQNTHGLVFAFGNQVLHELDQISMRKLGDMFRNICNHRRGSIRCLQKTQRGLIYH